MWHSLTLRYLVAGFMLRQNDMQFYELGHLARAFFLSVTPQSLFNSEGSIKLNLKKSIMLNQEEQVTENICLQISPHLHCPS